MLRSLSGHRVRWVWAASAVVVALVGGGCSDDGSDQSGGGDSAGSTVGVRLNEIQVIGSHNSYKTKPRAEVADALSALAPSLFDEIDYGHRTLTEQLEEHGVRQFEIDVFADPEGGRYATPAALELLDLTEPVDPQMLEPGFKVQHIQDIDYAVTCVTLVACLTEIETWSSANPKHLPVMVMVETKTGTLAEGAEGLGIDLPDLGVEFADGPDMTAELFEDLEAEVLSVFDREDLLVPDDVRGDADTLEQAILEDGWPTVDEARGKVMLSLVSTGEPADIYRDGAPSLEGRLFFTSGTPGEPDAAFVRVDDSLEEPGRVEELARAGYLIRTRTDVPGVHAPEGDTSLRESAITSGGHFLSTDYYVADPELGTGYIVELEGDRVAQCNPVVAPDCDIESVIEE